MSEHQSARFSTRAVLIVLVVIAAAAVYASVGIAYASSVSYLTPGGNWLENLLNLSIRVIGWPILLATHQ